MAGKDGNECPAWVRALTRGTAGRQFYLSSLFFLLLLTRSRAHWNEKAWNMAVSMASGDREGETERERQREARSETVLRDKQLV